MERHPGPDADLTDVWAEHRRYLTDLAFRMLGSISDAEDVVQEAFVRLMRVDADEIDDLRGWLVVVVSRLCLDHLRSARVRHEDPADPLDVEVQARADTDPAERVTLDDHVRMALLVVLQRLTPAERAVFVLHDVFQFSFDAVATIVGRTPAACRQLASRARRRVETDTGPDRFDVDPAAQQQVAERFIAACAGGDLQALMNVLEDDVAGQADLGGGKFSPVFVGRERVATNLRRMFGPGTGMVLVSQPVNGEPGVLAFKDHDLYGIIILTVAEDGLIHHIHAIADPEQLAFVTAQVNASR